MARGGGVLGCGGPEGAGSHVPAASVACATCPDRLSAPCPPEPGWTGLCVELKQPEPAWYPVSPGAVCG